MRFSGQRETGRGRARRNDQTVAMSCVSDMANSDVEPVIILAVLLPCLYQRICKKLLRWFGARVGHEDGEGGWRSRLPFENTHA